jgi:hypothetical protein
MVRMARRTRAASAPSSHFSRLLSSSARTKLGFYSVLEVSGRSHVLALARWAVYYCTDQLVSVHVRDLITHGRA